MVFDTTTSNTGIREGSCPKLEDKLKRKLLNLACRHHIAEIYLKAAFESCLGGTSGPEVLLFKRLQSAWPQLNQNIILDYSSSDEVSILLSNIEIPC